MNLLLSIWTKANNLIAIPNTVLFFKLFLVAIVWRWICHRIPAKYNLISILVLLGAASWHFGVVPVIDVVIILGSAFLFGVKVFRFKDQLLATIVGLISFVQIFTMLALLTNVTVGYHGAMILFCLIAIVFKRKEKINFNILSLEVFNVFDWTLIFAIVIFSSLPQMNWDAVQANLYIARWYVLANSLTPMKEGLSSLFPQGAIVYYSLFYKAGGLKLLQVAFFLPFLLTLLLIKKIIRQVQVGLIGKIIVYTALTAPIVIFLASNGYYDNLILFLLLTAAYLLFFFRTKNFLPVCLSAALLIGFATGIKFFPLVMAPLPLFVYLRFTKITFRSPKFLLSIAAILLLTFGPVGIWLARTYAYTGSPVFPFYQHYFPTPDYWDVTDHLENNFMIQTTMSSVEWLKGGFITYPFKSYFNSTQFIEGTRGYPGFLYLAMMPFQVLLLFITLVSFIRKRQLSHEEEFFLYAFLMYFAVGLMARYYRYVWSFQFLWLFSTLPLLFKLIAKRVRLKGILTVMACLLLPINFINLIDYYRYYPLDQTKVFRADYYLSNTTDRTPIAYINAHAKSDDLVLDSAKFPVLRLHFKPRVYQCSWYWMGWAKDIKNPTVLTQFRYIVADDPFTLGVTYCGQIVQQAVRQGVFKSVYQDGTYTIYEQTRTSP